MSDLRGKANKTIDDIGDADYLRDIVLLCNYALRQTFASLHMNISDKSSCVYV